MRHTCVVVLCCTVLALDAPASGTAPGPLTVAEIRAVKRLTSRIPISLSPDGEWVAYTVQRPDRATPPGEGWWAFTEKGTSGETLGSEVWIARVDGTRLERIGTEKATSWAPQWSPDGQRLAFFSDADGRARLWIWERSTGKARPPSTEITRAFFGFEIPRWMPDSRRVVVKLHRPDTPLAIGPDDDPSTARQAESLRGQPRVRVHTSPAPESDTGEGQSSTQPYRGDLALIDVSTGHVSRLAENINTFGYWPSPDGRHVAFLNRMGTLPVSQQHTFALEVVSAEGQSRRVLAPDVRQQYGISVSWAPDSSRLAYTAFGQMADGKCHLVDLKGSTRSVADPDGSLGSAYGTPLWDPNGQLLYLVASRRLRRIDLSQSSDTVQPFGRAPDGEWVFEIVPVAGHENLAHLPGRPVLLAVTRSESAEQGLASLKADGQMEVLHLGRFSMGSRPRFSTVTDGSHALIAVESTDMPQRLRSFDLNSRRSEDVAGFNPELDKRRWGTGRLIEWRSRSDTPLRGAVLLPPGVAPGERLPAIVQVYGGSRQSEQVWRFNPDLQMWLSRGYVVFLPDMPMQRGAPVREIVDAVVPAVDKLIAEEYADPQRIGVWGWSYGGYSVLALITQTDRFRAAVMGAGFGNLLTHYSSLGATGNDSLGYVEKGQGGLTSSPWVDRDSYIENSPFFFLDRIQAPTLIIHGALDSAVPVRMSYEVFVGLRRLGKRAELAVYLDEDHSVEQEHNAEDYWNRMIAWFDEHLAARDAVSRY